MNDICFECTANGDDYYIDENGNTVSSCDNCYINNANIIKREPVILTEKEFNNLKEKDYVHYKYYITED